jgi:hypothetical protein
VVEPVAAERPDDRPREAAPTGSRRSRRGGTAAPSDAVTQLERMRRSQTRRRP